MSQIATLKYIDENGTKQEVPVWEESDVHYPALKVKTQNGVGCIRYCEDSSADLPGIYIHTDTHATGFSPIGIGSSIDEIVAVDYPSSGSYTEFWASPIDCSERGPNYSINETYWLDEGPVVEDMPSVLTCRYDGTDYNIHSVRVSECCWSGKNWIYTLNSDLSVDRGASHRDVSDLIFSAGNSATGDNEIYKLSSVSDSSNPSTTKIKSGYSLIGGVDFVSSNYFYGWGFNSSQGSPYLFKMDFSGNIDWEMQLEQYDINYTDEHMEKKVAVSPDENYVAVGRNQDSAGNDINQIEIRDTTDGSLLASNSFNLRINAIKFSPNSQYIYVTNYDYLRQLNVSDASTRYSYSSTQEYSSHSVAITDVGVETGGNYVYVYAGIYDAGSDDRRYVLRKLNTSDFSYADKGFLGSMGYRNYYPTIGAITITH